MGLDLRTSGASLQGWYTLGPQAAQLGSGGGIHVSSLLWRAVRNVCVEMAGTARYLKRDAWKSRMPEQGKASTISGATNLPLQGELQDLVQSTQLWKQRKEDPLIHPLALALPKYADLATLDPPTL